MKSLLGRAVRAILLAGLVGFLYLGLTVFEVWRIGRATGPTRADAIVVMGAAQYDGTPSPQLAARLDHAVVLWNAKVAPLIIVTGGNQPGDRFTEASASRDYLVKSGVPDEVVREEATSHSTWEAFENLRSIVDQGVEVANVVDIVVVTDPFHSLRSRLIAEENGFNASTSSTTTSPVTGSRAISKHLKEALGVAIGRVIGFERLWKVTG